MMMSSPAFLFGSRHQQGHSLGFHLESNIFYKSCRNIEAETNCNYCNNRTLYSVIHNEGISAAGVGAAVDSDYLLAWVSPFDLDSAYYDLVAYCYFLMIGFWL